MNTQDFTAWTSAIRKSVMRAGTEDRTPGAARTEPEREAWLRQAIERALFADPRSAHADAGEKRRAVDQVFNAMRRLDVLEPLMRDPATTEIMVNGPDSVFVERNGRILPAGVRFESRERLEDLIQSLVSRVNRMVNESEPIVDARLEDGSRINAVMPPIALDGPLLTIRRFPDKPLGVTQLIALGALSEEAASFLERLVKARYNLFVCGGTGSGKTTLLNVLSAYIPSDERIVSIEDSAELQLAGIDNLARLETRNPNAEGKGGITMKQLIRTSLRMRPDRIIVGEVRGDEAFDMLQAMNTGHDGSMSTGHANSPADMMDRLETMVSMATAVPLPAIRRQIASAIEVVVFLQRLRDHSRRVVEIAEVTGCTAEGIELVPLFRFLEAGAEGVDGRVAGTLVPTGAQLTRTAKLALRGMA